MNTAHYMKQKNYILDISEALFVKDGIQKVTISQISKESRLMRSTIYKYFPDKEILLWEIQARVLYQIAESLEEWKDAQLKNTTYNRIAWILDKFYTFYLNKPNALIFSQMFNSVYQPATLSKDNATFKRLMAHYKYNSKDTVKFITRNFHDGSVNPNLDPNLTAVSIIYSALSIIPSCYKMNEWMPLKYGISSSDLIRQTFQLFLDGVGPSSQIRF